MTEDQHDKLMGIVAGRSLIQSLTVFFVLLWLLPFYQCVVYAVFAFVIAFIWNRWRLFRQAAAIENQPKV